jgi:HEPN domain-containing protein/predicted nucleotidyltransferase
VERLRPRRIVLFGSRARGTAAPESDYDIMIEMETDLRPIDRDNLVYDLFPGPEWSMDVFVYTPDEVRRWQDDVGMILYDIVREGRVLYSDPDSADRDSESGVSGALAPRARVSERRRGAPESLALWMRRATNDFVTMEGMARSDPPPWDIVCFHAHQAVEKLLKACLVAQRVRPPTTHSLPRLLEACRRTGISLPRLRGPCRRLQRLYPRSRYPTEKEPTGLDAKSAIAAATAIRDAILPVLERAR